MEDPAPALAPEPTAGLTPPAVSPAALMGVVVFAWGVSWFGIRFQINEASPLVSVAYRFLLSATIMCGGLMLAGRWRALPLRDQPRAALIGGCLFSMNFVCFYAAARYIPSGILSVVFATASVFGAINGRLFFAAPLERRVIGAAALGLVGLGLLLWPELTMAGRPAPPWWAVALPFLGTFLFSLGSLVSARLAQEQPLVNVVAQSMCWGAAILVLACLVSGQDFVLPARASFWLTLGFLSVVSSVVAFLAFMALARQVGGARASFATMLIPIVAMGISSLGEGYDWTAMSAAGLVLALLGTRIALKASTPPPVARG